MTRPDANRPRNLAIQVANLEFEADLEWGNCPNTCTALVAMLPYRARLVQARWSGEAAWIPMGDVRLGLGPENATSYPAPGELLLYPGGVSEMEMLFPYGPTCFASRAGQLAGNHFATVRASRERLAELGRRVLYEGAQNIVITIPKGE